MQLIILGLIFLSTVPAFVSGEVKDINSLITHFFQWWTLIATPITYWIFGVNIFHDASHFALSRNWRVNALGTYVGWWFSSPLEWYHQHVIGHHAYPNIPLRVRYICFQFLTHKDPDLYHNGKMERHTTTLRWRPMHAHQGRTW